MLGAGESAAHRTSLSRVELAVEGDAVAASVAISAHDLAVAVGIETDLETPLPAAAFEARQPAIERYIRNRLAVSADGARCAPGALTLDTTGLPENLRLTTRFACPARPSVLGVGYFLFFDIDPAHRALGRLATPAGAEEFLLDRSLPEAELRVAAPPAAPLHHLARIARSGAAHVLAGLDHVLFLVALLLVPARLLALAGIVTAFTLAHSVTLSLAWLGLLTLPERLVESLVALSVGYVAVENLVRRSQRGRWAIALGFGLVHGLGLYGALAGLDLAADRLVLTLVGFNLGVEAGQLAIVVAIYPLVRLSARWRHYHRVMRAGSVAILALAVAWFITRAFA